jgi:hypothetical protein
MSEVRLWNQTSYDALAWIDSEVPGPSDLEVAPGTTEDIALPTGHHRILMDLVGTLENCGGGDFPGAYDPGFELGCSQVTLICE